MSTLKQNFKLKKTIINYWFELATDTSGSPMIIDSTLTDTIKSVNNLKNLRTYYWRVKALNEIGWGEFSEWFKFTTIGLSSVLVNNEIPKKYNLYENFPDPFNPLTSITFDIPKSTNIKIIIYNALGKKVTTLVNEKLSAGSYEVDWDASGYPSGVYFYKLETEEFTNTKKMVLLK